MIVPALVLAIVMESACVRPLAPAAAHLEGPAVLAFPGAEGFGRFARGGRGGAVFVVETLDDAGPGSLRAAVEAEGPRSVVFAVAGTIALRSPLVVERPWITIAGESAPGDGITLRDQPLIIAADQVILRFLRSRLGDESGVEADAIWVAGGRDIMLDHVSASWSTDETLSVANMQSRPDLVLDRVTVQWSVIAESLDRSVHAKGNHGYGSLIRGSHGARYSFHHNLWAHHRARLPRPGNYLDPTRDPLGPLVDLRNNVIYNWGGAGAKATTARERAIAVSAGYNVDGDARSRYNLVGNAYLTGPDTRAALAELAGTGPELRPWIFFEAAPNAWMHAAGNSLDGQLPVDPWTLIGSDVPARRLDHAFPVAPVITDDVGEAFGRVLRHAGASRERDAVDRRIVASVRDGGGGLIDSQTDVGGWPVLRAPAAPSDSDRDGLPDAWERAHGLDPCDPSDAGLLTSDGYTWLERYLHQRADGEPDGQVDTADACPR